MPHASARLLRLISAAIAVLALAFLLEQHRFYAALPADDAFLHLRVAARLAAHGEPYFNAGEAVCATSSPLWVLLLAVGTSVCGPSIGVAVTLAALSLAALYLALAALLARELPSPLAVLGAFLVTALTASSATALLMESALALAFWCRSAAALRDERSRATGAWAGLAFATRPEMALWLVVALAATRGLSARLRVALGATPFLLSLAAWMLGWYGDLISASVRAKSVVYELDLAEGLASLRFGLGGAGLALTAGALLALLVRVAPTRRATAAILAFGLLLPLAYVSQRTLIFSWYRPLYLLPLLAGALLALTVANARTHLLAFFCLLACGARPGLEAAHAAQGILSSRRERWVEYAPGLRVQRYLHLGAELDARFPHASLLAPEIGALGWSFRGRILDGLGLATPAALAFHPLPAPALRPHGSSGTLPPRAIEALRPDLVVALDVFGAAAERALQRGTIAGYRLLLRTPALLDPEVGGAPEDVRLWGARETWVYARAELLDAAGPSSIHTGQ